MSWKYPVNSQQPKLSESFVAVDFYQTSKHRSSHCIVCIFYNGNLNEKLHYFLLTVTSDIILRDFSFFLIRLFFKTSLENVYFLRTKGNFVSKCFSFVSVDKSYWFISGVVIDFEINIIGRKNMIYNMNHIFTALSYNISLSGYLCVCYDSTINNNSKYTIDLINSNLPFNFII